MAQGDGLRIAAMLTADADLKRWARGPALGDRDLHQLAAIQQLPELVKRVRELEARLKKLEEGKAE